MTFVPPALIIRSVPDNVIMIVGLNVVVPYDGSKFARSVGLSAEVYIGYQVTDVHLRPLWLEFPKFSPTCLNLISFITVLEDESWHDLP